MAKTDTHNPMQVLQSNFFRLIHKKTSAGWGKIEQKEATNCRKFCFQSRDKIESTPALAFSIAAIRIDDFSNLCPTNNFCRLNLCWKTSKSCLLRNELENRFFFIILVAPLAYSRGLVSGFKKKLVDFIIG